MRPRRASWWLLCLVIALLPLRGLAHGWMPGSVPAVVTGNGLTTVGASGQVAGSVATATGHASAQAAHAPCHAVGLPASADASTDGAGHGKPAPHPGCALCDLCHSPLARMGEPVWALSTPVGDAPASTPRTVAPDAPTAGIFRPPRG